MDEQIAQHELFSVRQRRAAESGRKDVYQYDSLPQRFRAQVIYIWMSSIGPWAHREEFVYDNIDEGHVEHHSNQYWGMIFDQFCREVGLLDLPGTDAFDKLKQFFLEAETTDCLDLIDLTFQVITVEIRHAWDEALAKREYRAANPLPESDFDESEIDTVD